MSLRPNQGTTNVEARRIALLVPNPLTGIGGLEIHTIELARQLSRSGSEVLVLCTASDGDDARIDAELLRDRVRTIRMPLVTKTLPEFPRVGPRDLASILIPMLVFWETVTLAALWLLLRFKVTRVIVRHSVLVFPAVLTLRLLRAKIVADGHPLATAGVKRLFPLGEKGIAVRAGPAIRLIERLMLSCYTAFRASSPTLADDPMLRAYSKTVVVPLGVEIRSLQELNLDEAEEGIGYWGILEEWWDLDALIEAFEKLAPKFPGWRLHIIGSGPRETTLRIRLAQSPFKERITLHGWVPRSRLPEYLKRVSVAVVPLRYSPSAGSIPTKMVEAAAAGRAIVSSKVSGITDFFTEEEVAFVQPWDANRLAQTLQRVMTDGEYRKRLAGNARRKATIFDSEHVAQTILQLLADP